MSEYIEDIYDLVREKSDLIQKLYKEAAAFRQQNPEIEKGCIFDREQSVRWNEEEVVRRNNSRNAKLGVYTRKHNELVSEIEAAIKQVVRQEYSLNESQAGLVFDRAYEYGHSDGYQEVAIKAMNLAAFVSRILKMVE